MCLQISRLYSFTLINKEKPFFLYSSERSTRTKKKQNIQKIYRKMYLYTTQIFMSVRDVTSFHPDFWSQERGLIDTIKKKKSIIFQVRRIDQDFLDSLSLCVQLTSTLQTAPFFISWCRLQPSVNVNSTSSGPAATADCYQTVWRYILGQQSVCTVCGQRMKKTSLEMIGSSARRRKVDRREILNSHVF